MIMLAFYDVDKGQKDSNRQKCFLEKLDQQAFPGT